MQNIQSSKECSKIIEKLPYELKIRITDNLDLEDLLRLRLVCKSWYRVFRSNDICIYAIKKHFTLPLDYYYEKSGLDCTELEEWKKKENWLQRFVINRIRREHGFASRTFDLDHNLWQGDFKFRYSNGRVAFHDRLGFTIEDLITRKQYKFINPPHTVLLPNWQLSDSYLLVPFTVYSSMPLGRELVACDLDSRRIHSICLSENVESLSAYKNRVGIVTVSFTDMTDIIESYIWYVGSTLTTLQQIKHRRNASGEQIMTSDIFFPILEKARFGYFINDSRYQKLEYWVKFAYDSLDVIFFVYQTLLAPNPFTKVFGTRVTVQCFEAGVLTLVQHEDIYTSTRPEEYCSTMITNDGIIYFEVRENPNFRISKDFHTHITYDMSRRQFNRMGFYLHPSLERNLLDQKNFVWRDQIFNPFIEGTFGKMQEMHVITISKSLSDVWTGNLPDACKRILSCLKSSVLCSEARGHCSYTERETLKEAPIGCSRRAWGDDTFLIMYLGGSLKVWQFDDLGLEPTR